MINERKQKIKASIRAGQTGNKDYMQIEVLLAILEELEKLTNPKK